jgi:hypothetical protein
MPRPVCERPAWARALLGAGLLGGLLVSALLTGCQSGPQPLYDWGPYQAQVYEGFKGTGNGPEAQLQELERHLEATTSRQRQVPPGYLAHMGYLYLQTGRNDMAAACWQREKAAFPESKVFMDFLLNNLKKQGQ